MTEITNRLFSGVQPTGDLHLGNYLGAIRRFAPMQNDLRGLFWRPRAPLRPPRSDRQRERRGSLVRVRRGGLERDSPGREGQGQANMRRIRRR